MTPLKVLASAARVPATPVSVTDCGLRSQSVLRIRLALEDVGDESRLIFDAVVLKLSRVRPVRVTRP